MVETPLKTVGPSAVSRAVYIIATGCITGLLLFVFLFVLLLRTAASHALEAESRGFLISAVLRIGSNDQRARQLAADLEKATPGLHVDVITSERARNMLALQESWMEKLPDIEIGQLPPMLKLRHPGLSTSPDAVEAYVEVLQKRPDFEFVMFNSAGYQDALARGKELNHWARAASIIIWSGLAVFFVLYELVAGARKGRHGPAFAIFAPIVMTAIAAASALGASWVAGAFVPAVRSLPSLPRNVEIAALGIALAVLVIMQLRTLRLRQRRRPSRGAYERAA